MEVEWIDSTPSDSLELTMVPQSLDYGSLIFSCGDSSIELNPDGRITVNGKAIGRNKRLVIDFMRHVDRIMRAGTSKQRHLGRQRAMQARRKGWR